MDGVLQTGGGGRARHAPVACTFQHGLPGSFYSSLNQWPALREQGQDLGAAESSPRNDSHSSTRFGHVVTVNREDRSP